jgi:hypothetical protein
MSVATDCESPEGAASRPPFSAAAPDGAPSVVQASVMAMAMARVFTNPDPSGLFLTH